MHQSPFNPSDFFDGSAAGWLLSLLFFPTGVITLVIAVFLVRRAAAPEDNYVQKNPQARHMRGSLRRLTANEVSRVCSDYAVPRKKRRQLERAGVLGDANCGLCLERDGFGSRVLQLPCGHFHHAGCIRLALEADVAACPSCGWCIKSLFGLQPDIPLMCTGRGK